MTYTIKKLRNEFEYWLKNKDSYFNRHLISVKSGSKN
jgi:hypothetical protein